MSRLYRLDEEGTLWEQDPDTNEWVPLHNVFDRKVCRNTLALALPKRTKYPRPKRGRRRK